MNKTNAMRMLDAAKIPYLPLEYEVDESDLSGVHIAAQIGLPLEQVFKTIVLRGDKKGLSVFCVPVACEIDLKKAAQLTGDKKVEPLHVKELLSLTGYIRGGCSPIGMKKKFPTYIDKSAEQFEKITVSAGVRGIQLLLNAGQLIAFTDATVAEFTVR